MLELLLVQNENKALEFKENAKSLMPIIKTVIAFANTAGGNIVIGVQDKKNKVIGVENPLQDEERLASAIVDSIEPLVIPDIQIITFRNRELLIIQVPHLAGPVYLKSSGLERGTYIRVGSTNRAADSETILSLKMLAKNISFDELPCIKASINDLDSKEISTYLSPVFGEITKKQYESLGLITRQHAQQRPTNAGILLFCPDRFRWFPDTAIACVCFADETHEEIIDQQVIHSSLLVAHEVVFAFIRRNTKMRAEIQAGARKDISQYPEKAIREAFINAVVHADYALKGSRIQVSIFSDRIEITNPGSLPYGQTMALALSGVSRMRNRVLGRLFRELKLIEQLGTGLKRILAVYEKIRAKSPLFQEIDTHFRVTLYTADSSTVELTPWEKQLTEKLNHETELSTTEIAKLWKVTTRTARTRLKKMLEMNLINRIATSAKDPQAIFKLK
ncbi:MAG: hypothetical protein A3E82_08430 [Gammaproteobacteria bacterium RIFCSPHIGHO2_12_FULL_38_11]|nr:MAG: hypothetical protein A3E82_08430 [Gammaproteobacteria bacterium RIFCSPHIGHO2_12_FULL_38_11]